MHTFLRKSNFKTVDLLYLHPIISNFSIHLSIQDDTKFVLQLEKSDLVCKNKLKALYKYFRVILFIFPSCCRSQRKLHEMALRNYHPH